MNNFDKIIHTIEKEEIKHTPKWYFQTKSILFWITFLFALLIGSIAFSIILFSIQQTDFFILQHLHHSTTEAILVLIPYFWLIAMSVFSLIGFFSFENFKKAYKHHWYSILGLNILLSLIIGTILFLSGGAKHFEETFANQVEIYRSVEEQKTKHWMNPEAGFLAGEIIDYKIDTLLIKDFKGKNWTIFYHDIFIPPIIELEKGVKIKVMGGMQSENTFKAEQIRPWKAFENQQKGENKRKN
jgi:hypothetical protein